jgi:putative transposase
MSCSKNAIPNASNLLPLICRSLFINNLFDGLAGFPTFKKRLGRQSMQYPQNVKILSNSSIKFPGNLGRLKAKIYRDAVGKLSTATVSRMPDGRY